MSPNAFAGFPELVTEGVVRSAAAALLVTTAAIARSDKVTKVREGSTHRWL